MGAHMPISHDRLRLLSRMIMTAINIVVALGLVLTLILIRVERSWVKPVPRSPEEAFLYGSIGTELMPLPVAEVLPDLIGKDWIDLFGFISSSKANQGLPLGF